MFAPAMDSETSKTKNTGSLRDIFLDLSVVGLFFQRTQMFICVGGGGKAISSAAPKDLFLPAIAVETHLNRDEKD